MKKIKSGPSTIFTDIGGVLLTNGWDREARKNAIKLFNLDPAETEERHHLSFDTYESGKISLSEYLKRLVFYTKRDFSEEDFRAFMFEQSQPYTEMLDLVRGIKKNTELKLRSSTMKEEN